MSRKEIIEALIMFELEWLHSNFDKHSLLQVTEFFRDGGFGSWTDEALQEKYDLFIKEGEVK
jgi:hypothetical protein